MASNFVYDIFSKISIFIQTHKLYTVVIRFLTNRLLTNSIFVNFEIKY